MTLLPEWKRILRHALSIQFNLLLLAIAFGDAAYGAWTGAPLIPPPWGALVAGLLSCGAILARITLQKRLSGRR